MEKQKRKTVRLQEYNYQNNGSYFVTICTEHRQHRFWKSETPVLNEAGQMVLYWLKEISHHFPGVYLDSYAIMADHIHILLRFETAQNDLLAVISWLKTMTTNAYIRGVKAGAFPTFQKRLWQRSYYDHIIRNETDLFETRKYIVENPARAELKDV